MRIDCPNCGSRDRREFQYLGAAVLMDRPAPDAGEQAFVEYVYFRENPAGAHRELWLHEMGCRSWIVAERNMGSHEFALTRLAADVKRGAK